MKRKVMLLLVVAVLLASSTSFACGKAETVEATTATWLPADNAVRIQNVQGLTQVEVKGLELTDFTVLSDTGQAKIELVAEPEPGDVVVVLLNRQCGAEELIILGQYIEARNYVGDLYELQKTALDAFTDLLNQILSGYGLPSFIPAVSGWLPSKGVAYWILKAEADKIETLPFVESMRGVKASLEAQEVIEMPFNLAYQTLTGEKEVEAVGASEFQVWPTQVQGP